MHTINTNTQYEMRVSEV